MRRFAQRVLAPSSKEVRHVVRDPRSLSLALGMPGVMILLFGFGVSLDLDRLPVIFSTTTRPRPPALRQRLTASEDLPDPGLSTSVPEPERRLEAVAVVVFPPRFEARLWRAQRATCSSSSTAPTTTPRPRCAPRPRPRSGCWG